MEETAPSWRDPGLWLLLLWGGAAAWFAFPPGALWPLAFLAPAPLLAWCAFLSPRRALKAGFFYGTGFFLGLIYWIAYTLTEYGYLHYIISTPILLLFVFYLALYPAFFAWGVCRVMRARGIAAGFAFAPFFWVGLEWLRGVLFTGFPWGELPLALWKQSFALQLAPVFGILGVSLLFMGVSTGLGWLLLPTATKLSNKKALLPAVAALTVWLAALLAGAPRSQFLKEAEVGVVQGNIEQGTKWAPVHRDEILAVYKDLTLTLAKEKKPDFILWPETAVPGFIQFKNAERKVVEDSAVLSRTPLIIGAPALEGGAGKKREDRNGVFSISENGNIVGRYDKVHLVPFGEYVPLQNLLPFIDKLTQASGDFRPGEALTPIPFGREGMKAGPLLCFESIFSPLAQAQAEGGANILVVLTNDAWFGKTSAPEQHLAYSAWRAAENGLWLVRAANTGISAVFDDRGRLVNSLPLGERGAFSAKAELRLASGGPGSRFRPWVGPFSLLLAAAFLSVILRAPKKTGR